MLRTETRMLRAETRMLRDFYGIFLIFGAVGRVLLAFCIKIFLFFIKFVKIYHIDKIIVKEFGYLMSIILNLQSFLKNYLNDNFNLISMNSSQERNLSMFATVLQFLSGVSAEILALMPGFVALWDIFRTQVENINKTVVKQEMQREGFSVYKQYTRDQLVSIAYEVVKKILPFATATNNSILYATVDYAKSDLEKSAEALLVAQCTIVHEKGIEFLVGLGDYGVTEEMLLKLKDAIIAFDESIPLPKEGVLTKKQATADLRLLFKEAKETLAKMFELTGVVYPAQMAFIIGFKNAKMLVDPSYKVLACRGIVVDENGERLGLVRMVCKELRINRKISEKGAFYLRTVPDGEYEFVFSRTDLETQVVKLNFYKGLREEVKVVMKRR
jgi:hypothetical protein